MKTKFFLMIALVAVTISCVKNTGNGIIVSKAEYKQLSIGERMESQYLFEGDYYYRVLMISGKKTGDTVNAVMQKARQKKIGDTVQVGSQGKNNLLTTE